MRQLCDVLVVGGGIVGLTAAIAMSQRGASVVLLDTGDMTADTQSLDSRVYAINQASKTLFRDIGVWDSLDKTRLSAYEHIRVWDALSQAVIEFDARMISSDCLGTMIEQSVIKEALLQRALTENITFYPHCSIERIESIAQGLCLYGAGQCWQTSLLMVADGALSMTRQMLGVPITTWPYHQKAIVTTVTTEKPHQKTAYQVFHKEGPLAFLPLANAHQSSIVWSTTAARAESLMTLSDDDFSNQLTHAFSATLGGCHTIGPRTIFPLVMRHVARYSGPHWVIMGDAAHTIHPMAGLGLNLGLADVAAWLALSSHETAWSSTSPLWGRYQRQRKHAVWQVIGLMEVLKTVFANPLLAPLRGFGLRLCDRSLLLKRLFIEQAER